MKELAFFDVTDGLVIVLSVICSIIAIIIALLFTRTLNNSEPGTVSMRKIGEQIQNGAKSFLHEEYKYICYFVAVCFVIISVVLIEDGNQLAGLYAAICFLLGAFLSGSAGYIGMLIATTANVLTTKACTKSLNEGLQIAFKSGAVMGLTVVGLGLLGLSLCFIVLVQELETGDAIYEDALKYMSGFGFGASSIALFARVGGGVYTKAADVGADLVGKVEAGIPEDHPNNPGVIADNVGDNVGDVAGMGADLFESYVGCIIAACTLATTVVDTDTYAIKALYALPFWLSGAGIICSLVGIQFVRIDKDSSGKEKGDELLESLLASINFGIHLASFLFVVCSIVICYVLVGNGPSDLWIKIWVSCMIGLFAGILIGAFTEWSTSYTEWPTQSIALKSKTGPAPVIIQGLGIGMIGTAFPCFIVVVTVIICFTLEGLYSVAIAAVGMLSTLGITLATDAYGPVADNAGGIAEMDEECDDEIRDRTDALDSLGNTTAATGKGFAIGSAVLTSIGLITAFMNQALEGVDVLITEPIFIVGVLIGACLPFVFAALTMLSVGRAAEAIIIEIRRQFRKYPELKEVDKPLPDGVKADATVCVQIATKASILEMIIPGVIAIFVPLGVGFLLTARCLAGLLIGSLSSGFMLAISMANAGGAWDNAKKWTEKGGLADAVEKEMKLENNGETYDRTKFIKKSECHKAVVVGDTVGDPFKDTSGPSLNILIKLMSMISLLIAPTLRRSNPSAKEWGSESSVVAGIIILVLIIPIVLVTNYYVNSFYADLNKRLNDDDRSVIEQTAKVSDITKANDV